MVMSMDGQTDHRMGSPMDESSVIGIRHQGSVDEELNEDEHSKASVQTVVGKQQTQQRSQQQQPLAASLASHSSNLSKQHKQHSAMVVSREHSFDDERKLMMHIDEEHLYHQQQQQQQQQHQQQQQQQHHHDQTATATKVVVSAMSDSQRASADPGRKDSLVTRMREIVEGGSNQSKPGQQQQQPQQQQPQSQAHCQQHQHQAKSSSGDSLNNQAENNSKASIDSNHQKRSHHSRHCDRHNHHNHHHHHHQQHHHHHHQQHQRPSLGAVGPQASATHQHHHNHHHHHQHRHQVASTGQHQHPHRHHHHHHHHQQHQQSQHQAQAATSSSSAVVTPTGAAGGRRASTSCQKRSSSQRPANLAAAPGGSTQVESLEQSASAADAETTLGESGSFVHNRQPGASIGGGESKSSTTSSVSSAAAVLMPKDSVSGKSPGLETIEATDEASAVVVCDHRSGEEAAQPHHHQHQHHQNHHHHHHLHSQLQQQPHHHHPHHHHHHYYGNVTTRHHHHRNHKKRIVLDTGDDDQTSVIETATRQTDHLSTSEGKQIVDVIDPEESKKVDNEERAGKRAPLQETTAHFNVCCPYHERHYSRESSSARHHQHPHHRHHHHHSHHQHQHQARAQQEQVDQQEGQKKELVESTGEQTSIQRAHHHKHHHHHHHHHGHHGKPRHRNKQKIVSIGDQNQKLESSQPNYYETGDLALEQSNNINKQPQAQSQKSKPLSANSHDNEQGTIDNNEVQSLQVDDVDSDNKMHLDDDEQAVGDGRSKINLGQLDSTHNDEIVTMDMSPNGDKRLHTAVLTKREDSQAKPSLTNEVQLVAPIEVQESNQRSQAKQSEELITATSAPIVVTAVTTTTDVNQAIPTGSTCRKEVGVDGGQNVCALGVSGSDTSNRPTNSTYEFSRNQEGDSVRQNKQANRLVRQVSSSRENSQKDLGSSGGAAGGGIGGAGGSSSSRQQEDQLIECMPQQSDTYHQASQPKQIIESAVPPDRRCRLCWCCCCPCSSLSNKNNSNKSDVKPNTEVPVTSVNKCPALPNVPLEEIRLWGDSFDRLMKCPDGRKVFQDFLRCEYSEENILFWIACEELKLERDAKSIATKARDIYEDYISILSAKEVSLDSRVRDDINNNIKKPTSNIFDEAQLQIYTLMHRDSYPRFLNSTMYKKLAQIQTTSRKGSAG